MMTDITPRGGTRVVCRIRPLANSERASCVASRGPEVTLASPASTSDKPSFVFDDVFDADASNEEVFRAVRPTLEDVKAGINGAVLAYGQSGAGKSHTMNGTNELDDLGIVQRAIADLVAYRDARVLARETCRLTFSALELYNERLVDLITGAGASSSSLSLEKESSSLRVVNDPAKGVWPRGAAEIFLGDDVCVDTLLHAANMQRSTASTDLNKDSSRSHLIVILRMETVTFNSKLFLVDLAGCEQVRRSNASGSRLDEARGINKSLSALGNVVAALTAQNPEKAKQTLKSPVVDDVNSVSSGLLSEGDENEAPSRSSLNVKKRKSTLHVPYRDSKLTFLLSEALGGNARAVLITCVSPDVVDGNETLSTLRFGVRARKIKSSPKRNKNKIGDDNNLSAEMAKQITELQALVCELRERLRLANEEGMRLTGGADDSLPKAFTQASAQLSSTVTSVKPLVTLQLWVGLCVAYFAVDVLCA